ncbi:MAG TPA: efflux RND transporter periplasmic adaptor subunit [Planctomycetia bacterium]|nr:efflux RND transporter periplasmic adaptor subunit [Planctomycetia bacterium]
MSERVDPQLLDQTRREISRLLAEIEQLAERDLPPADFHVEFLRRCHHALVAEATALWLRNPAGHMQLAAQINMAATKLTTAEELRPGHDELLRAVAVKGQPATFVPHGGALGEGIAGVENPSDYLLVVSPIVVDGQTIGVAEAVLDGARRSGAQIGYIRFLSRVAVEAAKFHKNRRFRQFAGQERIWNDLDAFIRQIHAGASSRATCYLLANDGRRLIGCERVSVAVKRGSRVRIESISGQDVVERKSNLVRCMGRLADKVLKHGETVVYAGAAEPDWPKDVSRSLSEYVEESNSRLVIALPLYDRRAENGPRKKPEACVLCEMIEDEALPEDLVGKVEVVARHGAIALYNSLERERIFLLPLWKALGKVTSLFSASRAPKSIAILSLLVGLVAFLIWFPWPLRMEGRGELVPKERRTIYAPMRGIVEEVKVDFRSPVRRGSELLVMSNPQLRQQLVEVEGGLTAKQKRRESLQSLRDERGRSKAEVDRDTASIADLDVEIAHLKAQVRLVNEQLDALKLVSPITGEVLHWNPKEKLIRKPVEQGEALIEIADVHSEWILDVQFPEKAVMHIAKARAASAGAPLPVTFLISSAPAVSYAGTLIELSTQAIPVDKENMCLARIKLDKPVAEDLRRPGAEVRVKVDCGPHSVGYVLFRELIDFVREQVFF